MELAFRHDDALCADARFVEVPLGRFAADELQRPRRVLKRPLHGRLHNGNEGLRDIAELMETTEIPAARYLSRLVTSALSPVIQPPPWI